MNAWQFNEIVFKMNLSLLLKGLLNQGRSSISFFTTLIDWSHVLLYQVVLFFFKEELSSSTTQHSQFEASKMCTSNWEIQLQATAYTGETEKVTEEVQ